MCKPKTQGEREFMQWLHWNKPDTYHREFQIDSDVCLLCDNEAAEREKAES